MSHNDHEEKKTFFVAIKEEENGPHGTVRYRSDLIRDLIKLCVRAYLRTRMHGMQHRWGMIFAYIMQRHPAAPTRLPGAAAFWGRSRAIGF